MSLPIPGVGTEFGPDYALDVNSCLTLLDPHDHSPGSGVQITPAGLNINATLSFQSNQATNLLSASFVAQGSASAVLQSLSVAPGTESPALQDLWYTDSAGNAVQITSNGLVNATLASIPGESYSGGTFFWKQGAGSTVPANFDIGSIVIRPNVAATTFGVSLIPQPTIASAYTLTLPADPSTAGGSNFLLLDISGNISGGALVDNSSIEFASHALRVKAGGITAAMLATSAKEQMQVALYTANGSFVVPDTVNWIQVLLVSGGGGGGGGGYNGSVGGGGGGGGGGGQVLQTLPVTPGETLTITVGAAGSAGIGSSVTTGGAGGNGGDSLIQRSGVTIARAVGGTGGQGGSNSGAGGAAGSAGSSIYYIPNGGTGANAGVSNGGAGGASLYAPTMSSTAGTSVSGKGGGGGGGSGLGVAGGNGGTATTPSGNPGGSALANSGAAGGGGSAAGFNGGSGGSGQVRIFYVSLP